VTALAAERVLQLPLDTTSSTRTSVKSDVKKVKMTARVLYLTRALCTIRFIFYSRERGDTNVGRSFWATRNKSEMAGTLWGQSQCAAAAPLFSHRRRLPSSITKTQPVTLFEPGRFQVCRSVKCALFSFGKLSMRHRNLLLLYCLASGRKGIPRGGRA
jgi:hypothetical protein